VDLSSADSLYVLDLNNFNWYIPKTTGQIPSSRIKYETVLIGKYMVVTFGKYNKLITINCNYILFYK